MEGEGIPMQEMHSESSEGDNKKVQRKVNRDVQIHGQYAVEIPDELPPLESLKFIDEAGRFTDNKIPTKEDLAYWYRKKLKLVGIFVALAGFTLLLIMLSATTKYANGVWEFLVMAFTFTIDFIIGLLPESFFSWIPF